MVVLLVLLEEGDGTRTGVGPGAGAGAGTGAGIGEGARTGTGAGDDALWGESSPQRDLRLLLKELLLPLPDSWRPPRLLLLLPLVQVLEPAAGAGPPSLVIHLSRKKFEAGVGGTHA